MEIIYFTLSAIVLYLLCNWILERLEIACGRRFEYRSVIFFFLLLVSSLIVFALIRVIGGH